MKLLIFILLFSTAKAQSVHNIFIAKPVAVECDTFAYGPVHNNNCATTLIYKFKDGSGDVCIKDSTGSVCLSKRGYRKWKRKNVNL